MPGRTLVLGDIHGCPAALDAVIEAADPRSEDTLIALGDYTDRGPDSRGVIDRLLALRERCRLIAIRGNHDLMFQGALEAFQRNPDLIAEAWSNPEMRLWLEVGGFETLDSYGTLDAVPEGHLAFLRALLDYYETDMHFFVHANYEPNRPLSAQPPDALFWTSLREFEPGPHISGKTAVVGHTSQKDGEVLDLGHLICVDTYCYGGGWLTLMDLESGQTWQADFDGRLRARS